MRTKLNVKERAATPKVVEDNGTSPVGKRSRQPGNVFNIRTGMPESITLEEPKPRRNWREERRMRDIVADHYGHAVVEIDGKKEVVDPFHDLHPYSSKNINKGGITAPSQDTLFEGKVKKPVVDIF